MSAIQMFNNGEFELSLTSTDNSFTVMAPGLARALAFRSAADMVRHVPDDEKGYVSSHTPGGHQQVWYLTEPGFYRVLGQRRSSRVKDRAVRDGVERFQRWVFHDVLPSVVRGSQQPQRRNEFGVDVTPPDTYTYDEVCGLLRQYFGVNLTVNELTRNLRAGGVLKQNGAPTKKHQHLFWFTGHAWNIHKHVVPQVAFKVYDTGRELQDFRFLQARLELEGVGQDLAIR